MSKEKWNSIVDIHNQYINSQESTIQKLWETIFSEIFGYSKLLGEIDSHRNMRIGSTDRLIPDIIIKNNNKDLFLIELKQHSKFFDLTIENQLISYLKILRINTGIIICNKIYIYFYDFTKSDSTQHKLEIEFKKDSDLGIKFIELFSKNTFDKDAIIDLVIKYNKSLENIKFIQSKINSTFLNELTTKFFTNKFSEDEIKKALNNFEIIVKPKTIATVNTTYSEVIENPYKTYIPPTTNANYLGKQQAINLCYKNNINVIGGDRQTTFASLNASANVYWAEPNIESLNNFWTLILNDFRNKQLHVFQIPANTINEIKFYKRNDTNKYQMLIKYRDINYTETKSNFKFLPYFIKTIYY